MKKLLIVGLGGHSKVIADIALEMGYSDISFVSRDVLPNSIKSFDIFYESDLPDNFYDKFDEVIVAIGNNFTREKKMTELSNMGMSFGTLIHPKSVVSRFCGIGAGSVVMANAVINAGAVLGKGVIINTGAIVEHECAVGDCVHVSPNALLAGAVEVGNRTWVCAGATVSNNVKIGADVIVGAGAVVLSDVPDGLVVYGVPAKNKLQKEREVK